MDVGISRRSVSISGYKVVTSAKNARVRPYPLDYLTRQANGGNFILQFRIPSHLKGVPPFGGRTTFRKSLRTKDRKQALRLRDEFFAAVGFYEPQQDALEKLEDAKRSETDQYFHALNALDVTGGSQALVELAEELKGQLIDIAQDGGSAGRRAKLQAQHAAVWRAIDEQTLSAAELSREGS